MLEFKISEEELMEMPADEVWLKSAWIAIQRFKPSGAMASTSSETGKGKRKGKEIPEQWRTKRTETTLPNGFIKVTNRVNVMDLWDNPQLLSDALSGR